MTGALSDRAFSGEILAPGEGAVAATVVARPFAATPQTLELPAGLSLREMLELTVTDAVARRHAWIAVGGETVPPEAWSRVRPKAGTSVAIRVLPAGGGGSGGGKSVLTVVVAIAVVAASIALPVLLPAALPGALGAAGLTWGTVAAFGVSVVGGLLLNALAPPPPQLGRSGTLAASSGPGGDQTPSYSVSAGRNGYSLYGAIPRVFGRHRIYPPAAARSYTEIRGNDQFLVMLVCWGYGPLQIEDLRIGETPVADYDDVQVETRQGWLDDSPLGLFRNVILEESLSIDLNSSGGRDETGDAQVPEDIAWTERTTEPDIDAISVDVVCPRGLYWVDAEGDYRPARLVVYVQYRALGGGWQSVESFNFGENRQTAVRHSRSWSVPRGQYEVRLAWAQTGNLDEGEVRTLVDTAVWSALRSVRSVNPVTYKGLALTALRVKASEEIQGAIDSVNAVVTSILPDWDGSAWTVRPTRNPAAAMRAVLTENRHGSVAPPRARANATPVPVARVDDDSLTAFHEACADEGWTFDYVLAERTSVWSMLRMACAAGRAAPQILDSRWRVVMDRAGGAPVQHFTPRNSWGFSSEKAFADLPHAFRVRFANELEDWQDDERFVYADHYDADSATIFEELDLPGTTHPDKVWQLGRYHLASAILRPEMYSWYADVEHLVCVRGSLVRVTHDAMLAGQGAARVIGLDLDTEDRVTAVTIDNRLLAEAGKSYMLALRDAQGECHTFGLANGAGTWEVLTLATPVPQASAPAVGDLVAYGESERVWLDLRVREIRPGKDLTARILAVDDAPQVHEAHTGAIPPYDPHLSPRLVDLTPPTPQIAGIESGEAVLVRDGQGVLQPRVVVAYVMPSGYVTLITDVELQARAAGTDSPFFRVRELVGDGVVAFGGVREGEAIELRLRFHAPRGPGPWTAWTPHTVIGQTSLPPDVASLRVENGVLRGSYPNPPLDLAGFRLRFRAGNDRRWADASAAHDGLLSAPEFPLAELPGGTLACLMKAVDLGGRESAEPAVAVLRLGDVATENVVRSYDRRAAGWPGAVTGGEVRPEGHIAAASTAAAWPDDDSAPAWPGDPDAPAWDDRFDTLVYRDTVVPLAVDLPCDLVVSAEVVGEPWRIDYRTGGAAAAWSQSDAVPAWTDDAAPAWSPPDVWRAWPGRLPVTRQSYEIRVTTGPGTLQGRVEQLRLQLDVEDRVESLDDVEVPPAGVRLPIAGPFRFITNVQLTLQDTGTGATTVRVLDKDPLGPLVMAYDAAGDPASASIDALVQGAAA
jgi:hypothetical protein